MLTTNIHQNRARADQTAGVRPDSARHVHKRRQTAPGRQDIPPATGVHLLQARAGAAKTSLNTAAGAVVEHFGPRTLRHQRSTIAAVVRKRVEMLHMNVIARELNRPPVSPHRIRMSGNGGVDSGVAAASPAPIASTCAEEAYARETKVVTVMGSLAGER